MEMVQWHTNSHKPIHTSKIERRNNVTLLIQPNYLLTPNHKEMPTSGIPQYQQLNKFNYFNFMPFSPSLLKHFDIAANMMAHVQTNGLRTMHLENCNLHENKMG